MKLFTKEVLRKLPPLYSTQDKKPEDIPIIVKFFSGPATFYITEGSIEEGRLFGYVTGLGTDELGYISIQELTSFRGRFGLGFERDMYYGKHTLKEVMNKEPAAL